ncbi:hypothetical protein E2C01_050385 [Portunus trituberculatus]|uniref:Uncharacterized protein n=1 Tax=Portunus trituberculatus TaxID=210409 RepID=A0A5B7GIT0_PORTR|nr:hypothetical protein [Portunus trituberculatus]
MLPPHPYSLHSHDRYSLNLSSSPGQHRTGWYQTQGYFWRRSGLARESETRVLTRLRQTYSERQGNRKHLVQLLQFTVQYRTVQGGTHESEGLRRRHSGDWGTSRVKEGDEEQGTRLGPAYIASPCYSTTIGSPMSQSRMVYPPASCFSHLVSPTPHLAPKTVVPNCFKIP